MNRCGSSRRRESATAGTLLDGGRRASVRAGRISVMTGMIADPRVLSVIEAVARGEDAASLPLHAGMTAAEVTGTLARLAAFGIVRRRRRGSRVHWALAGTNVAAWLAQGYEIAASLRRD